MDLLAFKIERDPETDVLIASWDDPEGGGSQLRLTISPSWRRRLRNLFVVISPADPRRGSEL
jgi:hypothetical protein